MALGKKTKVRADAKAPLRLTRLRSQLPGAPHIMQGLDSNNKTTEALPCDPDNIAMAESIAIIAAAGEPRATERGYDSGQDPAPWR
ncbi:hypothetical protein OCS_06134 [Ophiocordyceps sinensis CO18]|uniref:Uncharacterized protein n=1 Tax=Ophiocordyceps sinensis (strain Co18 / CGMCC 3.14243) TaxID=911162 RepID=T4ZYE9_OPHSC|nr:hypothetical protein OCS_06134 [Ophiocordyceps sinensis CO18]